MLNWAKAIAKPGVMSEAIFRELEPMVPSRPVLHAGGSEFSVPYNALPDAARRLHAKLTARGEPLPEINSISDLVRAIDDGKAWTSGGDATYNLKLG